MKIGIPKALLYYIYYPLWRAFFEGLGCEIKVSGDTNKAILDSGAKDFVDDACLPIKLFRGHVLQLANEIDAVFIPRLVSVAKREYICPKFCGLPEMIRYSSAGLPLIISDTLNMHRAGSQKEMHDFFTAVGRHLAHDNARIENAFIKAVEAEQSYDALLRSGFTPSDLLQGVYIAKLHEVDIDRHNGEAVGVIGHPYVIYDDYLSMNLIAKIRRKGFNVITPENISEAAIAEEAAELPKPMFYTFGKNIYASAMHMLRHRLVKGMVYMSAFGCGIDAFVTELVQRRGRRVSDIPIIVLNIDEHTGQAGLDTRLEAFLDMIRWRNRHEGNISSYRQHVYRG